MYCPSTRLVVESLVQVQLFTGTCIERRASILRAVSLTLHSTQLSGSIVRFVFGAGVASISDSLYPPTFFDFLLALLFFLEDMNYC